MGYDVTFHPFKRSEFKYYVEEVVEQPDNFQNQLQSIHSDNEERAFLSEGIYPLIKQFKQDILNNTKEYESTIGFASAALLGYLHPYWYSRGGLLSNLIGEEGFQNFFGCIDSIVGTTNKSIFSKAHNQILGNYSSGCYVPYEHIDSLIQNIKADSNQDIVEQHIGEYNKESLLLCLKYCSDNQLDLLEASDLYVPISGDISTYYPNLRATHLKNISNFENNSKALTL